MGTGLETLWVSPVRYQGILLQRTSQEVIGAYLRSTVCTHSRVPVLLTKLAVQKKSLSKEIDVGYSKNKGIGWDGGRNWG